jgi:hypothetical protein
MPNGPKAELTSQCLMCARFHDGRVEKCPRCGGRCHPYREDKLWFLERGVARAGIAARRAFRPGS